MRWTICTVADGMHHPPKRLVPASCCSTSTCPESMVAKFCPIVKNDAGLRPIPVIVMTNSGDDRDVTACYEIGANTYIQKPLDWSSFFEAARRLKEYWFETAILPKA